MSILLALLYVPAVQYNRGGLWQLMLPVTVLTLLIDVIANYTELSLLTWDWPRKGEYTFSHRLARLQFDAGWRGRLAKLAIAYTNYFDHAGRHI